MLKNWTLLFFLLLLSLSVTAQETTDSVYEFRFLPQKDMLYVPYDNNRAELERLSQIIRQYRREIENGRMSLHVDGYCNSLSGDAENLAVARLRSNWVKSELILHHGMTERCFITRNHTTIGDFVPVKVIFPAKGMGAVSSKEVATAQNPVADKPEEKANKPTNDEAETTNEAGTVDKAAVTDNASAIQSESPLLMLRKSADRRTGHVPRHRKDICSATRSRRTETGEYRASSTLTGMEQLPPVDSSVKSGVKTLQVATGHTAVTGGINKRRMCLYP